MIMETPATLVLDSLGIPYRLFQHQGPIHDLEQAALERGQQPGQLVRSLLFRIRKGEYILVLAAGMGQVSWSRLREYLGVNRLTTATEEEVRQVTGYEPGAVAPFGHPSPIRTLVDENVFLLEEISMGSGVKGVAIILKANYLSIALDQFETGRFIK